MADSMAEKGASIPWVSNKPIMKAPHALKGMRMELGAELESAM